MRLFLAIELPTEIKTVLSKLQTELRQLPASVSWTKPDNLHLTLIFLGEVEAARLLALKHVCAEAARRFTPFTLALNGVGVFPTARNPKVLWAGLTDEATVLAHLHHELEERLVPQGFGRKDKAFHPHLTIGRIKALGGAKPLVERALAQPLPALQFTATELVLMQSQLDPGGSIYTPLAHAPFSAKQSLLES